jgi:hypothetical protein
VQLLGTDGRPRLEAATWDRLRFRLRFRVDQAYRSFSAVLTLSTPDGTTLLLTSTSPDQTVHFGVEPGVWQVDCDFERFPLAAGEYVLGAGLAIPGLEYVWRNESLCRLHVAAADIFASGLAPSSNRYLIASPHQWSGAERVSPG